MYKIEAYKDMDNTEIFSVTLDGIPFNFSSGDVNSIEVYTSDPNLAQSIDSSTDSVTMSGDEVSIRFGRLNVPVGSYIVNLRAFTVNNPGGVVVQSFLVNMHI